MRYFFHIRHHDVVLEDTEGFELDGIDIVRREATATASEIIAERFETGAPLHIDTIFEVKDVNGAVVLALPFASVLLATIDPSAFEMPTHEGRASYMPLLKPGSRMH